MSQENGGNIMHVEFHRIYKSIDFEYFLEETSFIMAKVGMS